MNDDTQKATEGSESAVERFVKLQCACGCYFERPVVYFERLEEYEKEYPSAARFYERKVTKCDACIHELMKNALKILPDILKTLAT